MSSLHPRCWPIRGDPCSSVGTMLMSHPRWFWFWQSQPNGLFDPWSAPATVSASVCFAPPFVITPTYKYRTKMERWEWVWGHTLGTWLCQVWKGASRILVVRAIFTISANSLMNVLYLIYHSTVNLNHFSSLCFLITGVLDPP